MNNRLNHSFCLLTRMLFILICAAFLSSCGKLWHPQLDILEEAEGDWICGVGAETLSADDSRFYALLRIEKGSQQQIGAIVPGGSSRVFYVQNNKSPPTEKAGWLYSSLSDEGMTLPGINREHQKRDIKYQLNFQNEILIFTIETESETETTSFSCKRFRYRRTEIDELLGAIKAAALKTQKLQSLKNNESFLMCASVKPTGYCASFKADVCNDSNKYGEHADAVAMALLPALERNGCIDGGFYPPGEFNESTADDRYAIWMKEAYTNDSIRNAPSTRLSNSAKYSLSKSTAPAPSTPSPSLPMLAPAPESIAINHKIRCIAKPVCFLEMADALTGKYFATEIESSFVLAESSPDTPVISQSDAIVAIGEADAAKVGFTGPIFEAAIINKCEYVAEITGTVSKGDLIDITKNGKVLFPSFNLLTVTSITEMKIDYDDEKWGKCNVVGNKPSIHSSNIDKPSIAAAPIAINHEIDCHYRSDLNRVKCLLANSNALVSTNFGVNLSSAFLDVGGAEAERIAKIGFGDRLYEEAKKNSNCFYRARITGTVSKGRLEGDEHSPMPHFNLLTLTSITEMKIKNGPRIYETGFECGLANDSPK